MHLPFHDSAIWNGIFDLWPIQNKIRKMGLDYCLIYFSWEVSFLEPFQCVLILQKFYHFSFIISLFLEVIQVFAGESVSVYVACLKHEPGFFFVSKLCKEGWQNSWALASWPNTTGHAVGIWSWGWFFLADTMKLEWLSCCLIIFWIW